MVTLSLPMRPGIFLPLKTRPGGALANGTGLAVVLVCAVDAGPTEAVTLHRTGEALASADCR